MVCDIVVIIHGLLPKNKRIECPFCLPRQLAGAAFVQSTSGGECRMRGRGDGMATLVINANKSNLVPAQTVPFLGVITYRRETVPSASRIKDLSRNFQSFLCSVGSTK